MRQLRTHAELLAKVDVSVLITGESGTGKEWIARFMHRYSHRSAYELTKINCAVLDSDPSRDDVDFLTLALRDQTRVRQVYENGTILLEEVTEVPLRLQGKLLALMRDTQSVTADGVAPRIFATTSMNLETAVLEGRVRRDLYYDLTAFSIHVPPLRERLDELEAMLEYFMLRSAQRHNIPPRSFSRELLHACEQYSWPGNLRELDKFTERYLVLGDQVLALKDLSRHPLELEAPTDAQRYANHSHSDSQALKGLVRNAKQKAEQHAISIALEQTKWNRKQAARLLGISYRGLLYKIEHYHMAEPSTNSAHKSHMPIALTRE